jgi:hypothetical protein
LDKSPGLRRRAIILLTDGIDTTSRLQSKEAANRALAAETVIYAIGIGDSKGGRLSRSVARVAERTGGRAFFPDKKFDLNAAFAEIEQELRTQYLIAYSSTNKKRDGSLSQDHDRDHQPRPAQTETRTPPPPRLLRQTRRVDRANTNLDEPSKAAVMVLVHF